jgi:hypothetical protein
MYFLSPRRVFLACKHSLTEDEEAMNDDEILGEEVFAEL